MKRRRPPRKNPAALKRAARWQAPRKLPGRIREQDGDEADPGFEPVGEVVKRVLRRTGPGD